MLSPPSSRFRPLAISIIIACCYSFPATAGFRVLDENTGSSRPRSPAAAERHYSPIPNVVLGFRGDALTNKSRSDLYNFVQNSAGTARYIIVGTAAKSAPREVTNRRMIGTQQALLDFGINPRNIAYGSSDDYADDLPVPYVRVFLGATELPAPPQLRAASRAAPAVREKVEHIRITATHNAVPTSTLPATEAPQQAKGASALATAEVQVEIANRLLAINQQGKLDPQTALMLLQNFLAQPDQTSPPATASAAPSAPVGRAPEPVPAHWLNADADPFITNRPLSRTVSMRAVAQPSPQPQHIYSQPIQQPRPRIQEQEQDDARRPARPEPSIQAPKTIHAFFDADPVSPSPKQSAAAPDVVSAFFKNESADEEQIRETPAPIIDNSLTEAELKARGEALAKLRASSQVPTEGKEHTEERPQPAENDEKPIVPVTPVVAKIAAPVVAAPEPETATAFAIDANRGPIRYAQLAPLNPPAPQPVAAVALEANEDQAAQLGNSLVASATSTLSPDASVVTEQTPTPAAPPLPTWYLDSEKNLRENLDGWSSKAGFQLKWKAGNYVQVMTPHTFTSSFLDAVKSVGQAVAPLVRIEAYPDANPPEIRVTDAS